MKYLDYLKRSDNIDKFIVLMDELGYKDEEIIEKLEVSKTTVYNAKERQQPILEALKTIAAELPADSRNKDVQQIIDAFVQATGVTKTSKWDRFAAKRLADKHGAADIANLITVYFNLPPGQYKPSINSVRQLEEKWVNVKSYLERQMGSQTIEL